MPELESVAAPSLWNVLGVPSTKIPFDSNTFVSHVLPQVVCYFVLAVLAVTSHTHAVRVALWPLLAWLTLRAVLSLDMSNGKLENRSFDAALVSIMLRGAVRGLGWISQKEPLVRHLRPTNSSPSTIMDALDLVTNMRGHGWEWSGRTYIPRETRPANRKTFVLHTFRSALAHALILGVFHRAVLTLLPLGLGNNPNASTIFDETLPFLVRHLRAGIITASAGIAIYAGQQMVYDLYTVLAILFLGQDPAQWPPAFDAPWRATSLGDFWNRRWHQFLRQWFLLVGGRPLSLVLGHDGIVIGGFLASGLWHHITLLTYDSQADPWWNFVGFGMMAPGVLAERAFHRLTGKRVGGVIGWTWTITWLLVGSSVVFEGFARAPGSMGDRSTLIDKVSPLRVMVERLVMGFDEWLHMM